MAFPELVVDVHTVEHPPTWRPEPLKVTFLTLSADVSGENLLRAFQWARNAGLPNPRVISPALLRWSSAFHPAFFRSAQGWSSRQFSSISFPTGHFLNDWGRREKFHLQSLVFLAYVTLSAAIIQNRWSTGTIASKLDKLWHASDPGRLSHLHEPGLRDEVRRLASAPPGPDILLGIKHLFADALRVLSGDIHASKVSMRQAKLPPALAERFGFLGSLLHSVAKIQAVIVYGSSVSSEIFADYDIVLVVEDADATLKALCGTTPSFNGKELNISVYSQDELWTMQLISGDNLADYGLCLYGEALLPEKTTELLLARNFSFGMIRQRQQLGMIPSAQDNDDPTDDRRNLYGYFVKIPANVVKGTYGAVGQRWPKERVHDWLRERCGFDPVAEQHEAINGDRALPLARSAVATMTALLRLNSELSVVQITD
ncbi:hypothetical protein QA649_02550 [Bradyrhizobium sp. CB1717]|uniref:hypothetical protein n=1 Tax=Bradyrhizobium sp. CB1717 TaxID=3039154 RepID=UPI0024B20227|nr:hypothetical protein [Bradyrhizobium sp. CB1717]WFU25146.1 hypothetical protein QA649_02550 [Bradyrhizobium sp. CB1717]